MTDFSLFPFDLGISCAIFRSNDMFSFIERRFKHIKCWLCRKLLGVIVLQV